MNAIHNNILRLTRHHVFLFEFTYFYNNYNHRLLLLFFILRVAFFVKFSDVNCHTRTQIHTHTIARILQTDINVKAFFLDVHNNYINTHIVNVQIGHKNCEFEKNNNNKLVIVVFSF